jgi:hypothetical protein
MIETVAMHVDDKNVTVHVNDENWAPSMPLVITLKTGMPNTMGVLGRGAGLLSKAGRTLGFGHQRGISHNPKTREGRMGGQACLARSAGHKGLGPSVSSGIFTLKPGKGEGTRLLTRVGRTLGFESQRAISRNN